LSCYAANAAAGGPPLVSAQQLSGVVGMPAMQGTLPADNLPSTLLVLLGQLFCGISLCVCVSGE